MINFQDGIKVIKDCDFKISSSTTMAEAKEALEPYLLRADDRHITFMCNNGLNLENENLVSVFFCKNGLIYSIEIHASGKTIQDTLQRKDELSALCRKWLETNGQFSDRQSYDWGTVYYAEDFDRWYFMGIQIVFNRQWLQP